MSQDSVMRGKKLNLLSHVIHISCSIPVKLILLYISEDQTDEKVEELSKKRTLLAGFCKLIIFNIFDMALVAPIFSFLNKVRMHQIPGIFDVCE